MHIGKLSSVVACLVLAACGCSPEPTSRDDARTLHRGNDAEPLTLDPHKITMVRELEVTHDLFIGLYTMGPQGNVIPGLVETAQTSEDGLTWTFTLRETSWSDGVPLTAADVAFGIRRFLDPATLNSLAIDLFVIENAAQANAGEVSLDAIGVEALDDQTLQVRLAHPVPYLPNLFAAGIGLPAPRHALEEFGDAWVQPGRLVSNGPYTLAEWRSNNFVRLERNTRFFDAASVCFDTVFVYPTTDRQAAERRMRSGELDANVEIGPGGLGFIEENYPDLLRQSASFRANDLTFNATRPPFDNAQVRQALSMAIDRRFLAGEVTRGVKLANWRVMSPDLPAGRDDLELPYKDIPMAARREQARALLQAAGFGPDNPLDITLRIHPGVPLSGPVIQQDWTQIAPWVRTELLQNDIQLHYASMQSGDFDVGYASWTAPFEDPIAVLYQWESAAGEINYSNWTDPAFDALLTAARREADPDARLGYLADAEHLFMSGHASVPISVDINFDLVQSDITGWVPNRFGINSSRWLCRDGVEAREE